MTYEEAVERVHGVLEPYRPDPPSALKRRPEAEEFCQALMALGLIRFDTPLPNLGRVMIDETLVKMLKTSLSNANAAQALRGDLHVSGLAIVKVPPTDGDNMYRVGPRHGTAA